MFSLCICHGHKAAQVSTKHSLTVNMNHILLHTKQLTKAGLDYNDR